MLPGAEEAPLFGEASNGPFTSERASERVGFVVRDGCEKVHGIRSFEFLLFGSGRVACCYCSILKAVMFWSDRSILVSSIMMAIGLFGSFIYPSGQVLQILR